MGEVLRIDEVFDHPSFLRVRRYFRRRKGRLVSDLTLRIYGYSVSRFCRFLGKSVDEVLDLDERELSEALERWIDHLLDKGLASNTINSYVNGVVTWLKRNNVSFERPVTPSSYVENSDRAPTKEELRRLLIHSNLKMKTFILLAVSSGIRVGALVKLRWRDLDFDQYGDIVLINVPPELSKNNNGYYTFATPEAKEVLMEWKRRAYREHIFPKWSYMGMYMVWRRLISRTGLTEKSKRNYVIHPHTLRKFFRTALDYAGVREDTRELLMGHGSSGDYREAYYRPVMDRVAMEYRRAIPYLTIMREEDTSDRRRQLLDVIRLMYPDLAPNQLMEIEKMLSNLDLYTIEDIQLFLREMRRQRIVYKSELEKYIEDGYRVVMRLDRKRFIVER